MLQVARWTGFTGWQMLKVDRCYMCDRFYRWTGVIVGHVWQVDRLTGGQVLQAERCYRGTSVMDGHGWPGAGGTGVTDVWPPLHLCCLLECVSGSKDCSSMLQRLHSHKNLLLLMWSSGTEHTLISRTLQPSFHAGDQLKWRDVYLSVFQVWTHSVSMVFVDAAQETGHTEDTGGVCCTLPEDGT